MWRINQRSVSLLPMASLFAFLSLGSASASADTPSASVKISNAPSVMGDLASPVAQPVLSAPSIKPLKIEAASETPMACTAGTYVIGNDANQSAPVQYQTAHFAIRWNGSDATLAQAQAGGAQLESIWDLFINTIGFKPPQCNSASKYKVNITVNPSYGLTGGLDGQGYPGMWFAAGALADHWGLAHEFTHALQGAAGGLTGGSPYAQWFWEDHANYMAHQQAEYKDNYHCTELMVNAPQLYYGTSRSRYCSWQFFEFVKMVYGIGRVNDIWTNWPQPGTSGSPTADPLVLFKGAMGWNDDQLNDFFAGWAAHNVTWDYVTPDGYNERAGMFATYGQYNAPETYRANRTIRLDPLDLPNRRFNSPFMLSPQRWGYNLTRVYPDAGATSIKVTFRGVRQTAPNTTSFPGLNNEPSTVAQPNSDWRWTVVVVGSNGLPRYQPTMNGQDNDMTVSLQSGDQAVYLMVMGTPYVQQKVIFDQAYYTLYRYPYMVQFTNAMPEGYQPNAPAPFSNSHQHSNGGGWVSNSATVASTAYVGPYAQVRSGTVSGNARIQEHAIIDGGTVSGNAVVGGASIINNGVQVKDNAVVQTTFMPLGFFEPNSVIGGTAKLRGDVELRGGPTLMSGTYSGFVDQTASSTPQQGSTQTTMFPEITAWPNLTWR